jgi:hypothetical protein
MAVGRRSAALFAWILVVALGGVAAAVTHSDDSSVATAGGRNGGATSTTATLPGGLPGAVATDAATSDTAPTTATAVAGDTGGRGDGGTAPADTAPPGTTPAARIMPTPGTYTTNDSGTGIDGKPVPPQSTYTIEQVNDTDQHQGGQFDVVLRYAPESASLVSLKIAAANKSFEPAQPLLFVPFPGDRPDPWSWSVTSTDGKTTLNTTAQITGTETIDVGGQAVPTFIVDSTITITGDLQGTVHLTAWVSNDYRLPVKQHTVVNASYLTIMVHSDTTSVLASLAPS